MPHTSTLLGWLTVASLVLSSGLASSQRERGRPFLLGGPIAQKKREIRWDPRLPTGAYREFAERPEDRKGAALCSFTRPVCVHGAPGLDPQQVLTALTAMEAAYERVVVALGLPAPPPDGERGGSDALDLYLSESAPPFVSELDGLEYSPFDRGPSFCRSSARSPLALERAATQCVGEALGRGLDAGTTPNNLRAFATHLWWTSGSPTALDAQALDELQAHPEAAPLGRDLDGASEGAAAWFDVLEATRGQGAPAKLATGIVSLAASKTEPGRIRWHNEPDIFDVLRSTMRDDPIQMAGLMNDWAVERAFLGSRDDGGHVPSLLWSGDFGRVRFDWAMRYSSLPRRVASKRPIEPTGSIYVLVKLDDVALGATLGFQAKWEPPVDFVWSLVQLDEQGHQLKRLDVPFKEHATSAEQRLSNFEAASYLLVVGTNLGGIDRDHPFDPDVAPYEPHLCTVYLVRL